MNTENRETQMPRPVGEAYRALSTERTPEHVNRAVLKQASAAVARSSSYPFAGWLKPVAWTAVIALSLAVVLEIAEIQTVSTPDPVTPVLPPASKSELRNEESKAGREFTKIQPAQQPDAWERAESVAKPMARKASAPRAGCDDAARASPDDWMDCIRKLRESGAAELADREYEAFILEFPPE